MKTTSWKKTIKGKVYGILVAVLLGFPVNRPVLASAIGLPDEDTGRIGYLVGMSRFTVDDPDGPTQAGVDVLPMSLVYTDWLPHSWRYWAEAYYFATTLDAKAGEIKQKIARIGTRLTLQHNVNLGRWSVWLGGGLDLSRNQYTRRYSVDNDGFLLKVYEDRLNTAVGFAAQFVIDWPLAQNWDLAAKLDHVFHINGGVDETALSAGILYRY